MQHTRNDYSGISMGAVYQFLYQESFTPDGIPREGVNVTKWGPGVRERYLEKYGAKSDDDRNFLRSLSTNATPKKVEQKQEPKKVEPEPAPQMEGRVPTVNRKTQSRGRTIMNPLAGKNEGSTYKKKLLGD